jgi:hypothetical protein
MSKTMAATLSCSLVTGIPGPAASGEAEYILDKVEENWRSFQGTRTFGSADLFNDLAELAEECGEPDWDGYGALPVAPDTVVEAERFLRSIPAGAPPPTIGAEPDGHVTFEWHASPKRTLSVSISPEGELHYAALIGSSRHFGTVPFLGDCPDTIVNLVEQVLQS